MRWVSMPWEGCASAVTVGGLRHAPRALRILLTSVDGLLPRGGMDRVTCAPSRIQIKQSAPPPGTVRSS